MRGENIIPGWRSLPRLVGPVEIGSFTRWPRAGNPGVVVWRDAPTQSTQNRVGLKNPGARAAAAFLARGRHNLPRVYGINIAVSPGVDDPAQEQSEIVAALDAFLSLGIVPSWFTLNLSCPNTEDDPTGRQTEDRTRLAVRAALACIGGAAPLWVKLGPDLSREQYCALLRALADEGARAVIATNTLGQPAPDGSGLLAGVGGGRLHQRALEVAALLAGEIQSRGYPLDVIGCGGVLDGRTWAAFSQIGVRAVQYWSALVYRGPLAAALIANEETHA
jgi:dihydroorotate dehydrogenase